MSILDVVDENIDNTCIDEMLYAKEISLSEIMQILGVNNYNKENNDVKLSLSEAIGNLEYYLNVIDYLDSLGITYSDTIIELDVSTMVNVLNMKKEEVDELLSKASGSSIDRFMVENELKTIKKVYQTYISYYGLDLMNIFLNGIITKGIVCDAIGLDYNNTDINIEEKRERLGNSIYYQVDASDNLGTNYYLTEDNTAFYELVTIVYDINRANQTLCGMNDKDTNECCKRGLKYAKFCLECGTKVDENNNLLEINDEYIGYENLTGKSLKR